jgi:hypothetical protein
LSFSSRSTRKLSRVLVDDRGSGDEFVEVAVYLAGVGWAFAWSDVNTRQVEVRVGRVDHTYEECRSCERADDPSALISWALRFGSACAERALSEGGAV